MTVSGNCHLANDPDSSWWISSIGTSWPLSVTASTTGRSCHWGCQAPITAASVIRGWTVMAFSMSMEEIHSPPLLMTSLSRSVSLR